MASCALGSIGTATVGLPRLKYEQVFFQGIISYPHVTVQGAKP